MTSIINLLVNGFSKFLNFLINSSNLFSKSFLLFSPRIYPLLYEGNGATHIVPESIFISLRSTIGLHAIVGKERRDKVSSFFIIYLQ